MPDYRRFRPRLDRAEQAAGSKATPVVYVVDGEVFTFADGGRTVIYDPVIGEETLVLHHAKSADPRDL